MAGCRNSRRHRNRFSRFRLPKWDSTAMRILLSFIILILLAGPTLSERQKDTGANIGWPTIASIGDSVFFDGSIEEFAYSLPLRDTHGNTRYYLLCHGGSDNHLDSLGGRMGANLVGPLSCRLNFDGRLTGLSLLGEDSAPVWHSRSQFHTSELIGRCGEYPEYGRLRNFRLRGMVLTLATEDLATSDDGSLSLTLKISVRGDESARSSRAEPPGYLRPRNDDCDVVREGTDPLFCRNPATLEEEPCTDFE